MGKMGEEDSPPSAKGEEEWSEPAVISLREIGRGLPDMISAFEGVEGSWKSRRSEGGCVNFIV